MRNLDFSLPFEMASRGKLWGIKPIENKIFVERESGGVSGGFSVKAGVKCFIASFMPDLKRLLAFVVRLYFTFRLE